MQPRAVDFRIDILASREGEVLMLEIRCPIYGFIALDDWERDIISQPAFQRLRPLVSTQDGRASGLDAATLELLGRVIAGLKADPEPGPPGRRTRWTGCSTGWTG